MQDNKEFASARLNRDLWAHSGVRALMQAHAVLWQVGAASDQALVYWILTKNYMCVCVCVCVALCVVV